MAAGGFLISFPVLYNKIVSSAVMPIGSLVFSVGSVVFPVRSFIQDRWISLHWVGCTVVVLVLTSVFLHVKISVKVVRVFLGNVTSFLEHVCAGGGGNVTFHGIQFPAGILYHCCQPCTSGPH